MYLPPLSAAKQTPLAFPILTKGEPLMKNEDLLRIIVALGGLGYRVVSVTPEAYDDISKTKTGQTVLVITPTTTEK
jgi:hypothetical protein